MMKKPSLREVTRMVRETHEAYQHPDAGLGSVTLVLGNRGAADVIGSDYDPGYGEVVSEHSEEIPGDGRKFDAVAVARRLLAGLPR